MKDFTSDPGSALGFPHNPFQYMKQEMQNTGQGQQSELIWVPIHRKSPRMPDARYNELYRDLIKSIANSSPSKFMHDHYDTIQICHNRPPPVKSNQGPSLHLALGNFRGGHLVIKEPSGSKLYETNGHLTSAYMWAAATPPRRRHEARKSPSGPAGVRDSPKRKFDHDEIVKVDATST